MSQIEVDKVIPQSGTALQVGESGDTITIPAGATITNNGTANGFGSADTEKVKVSSNDTTAGFLNGKLVAGTNISLTEGTDGGNETLTAALSGTISTAQIGANQVTGAKLNTDVISAQTELATAPANTDELLISDAGTLKRIDVSLVGGANTPAFEAYLSADQSVSDATNTKVAYNVEHFDTDNAYDNSTNYRFTPQTSGKYFVYANVNCYAGDSNLKKAKAYIYKNGSAIKVIQFNFSNNYARQMHTMVSSVIDMNGSSDYIEIFGQVDSNSGSGQLFGGNTSAGQDRAFFGAYKLIT